MNRAVHSWITEQRPRIVKDTLRKLPFDVSKELIPTLLETLQLCFDKEDAEQTQHIQEWMQIHKDDLNRQIHEWTTIITTLKQQIIASLKDHLAADIVLSEFSTIDKTMTLAMGQISRVADNRSQADMLDQMIMLKEQLSMLEKNRKRFIHLAAHELKTPLTLLEGYAKMFHDHLEADDLQLNMYLGGIENGIDRLREIINDMIDVSLITSGSFTITRQPIALGSVLTKVINKINREFKGRSVRVEVIPLEKNHVVMGDPERLVQAFFKLVSNGVKYTPDGGTVTIDLVPLARRTKSAGKHAMIDVRIADTGVGISHQILPKVFEPFTGDGDINLHSTSKTKFMGGGPGLGLPIAKGVIEAHDGTLWVESDGYDYVGCPGSTFHVELPIIE